MSEALRAYSHAPEDDDPRHYAWRVQRQRNDGSWHDTDIHGESNWDLINQLIKAYDRVDRRIWDDRSDLEHAWFVSETLRKRSEAAEARAQGLENDLGDMTHDRDWLATRVKTLESALRFYASAQHVHLRQNGSEILEDQKRSWPFIGGDIIEKVESGDIARQALQAVAREEGDKA